MQTLKVRVEMTKDIITAKDRQQLCMLIIKQIMFPTQTIEAPYVPQSPQQRPRQASAAITALQCSDFLTQQKEMV